MRYAPQTPKLVESSAWLSMVDSARQSLYPSAQTMLTATSPVEANLVAVHQRVFVGTPDDPGLLGRVRSWFEGKPSMGNLVAATNQAIRETSDLKGVIAGVVGEAPTLANLAGQTARAIRGVEVPGESYIREGQTPSLVRNPLQAGRESTYRVGRRVLELADSLLPEVYSQTFSEVPLGYAESDLITVTTDRYQELEREYNNLLNQITVAERQASLATDVETQQLLDNQVADLNNQAQELNNELMREQQKTSFAIAPGRGYLNVFDQAMQDFERRLRDNPANYTPELVTSTMTSLQYSKSLDRRERLSPATQRYGPAADDQKLITPSEVNMILRNMTPAQRRNLKEDLIYIDPSLENDIRSMTAIDYATSEALAGIVYEAQQNGQDWAVYLQELKKSDLVVQRQRGSGGGVPTIQLPARDDVAALVQELAQRNLGQNIASETAFAIADQYVNYFETTFRQQLGGSTITEPMSAQTFAEQQIREQFETDYDVYQMGNTLDAFRNILGGMR